MRRLPIPTPVPTGYLGLAGAVLRQGLRDVSLGVRYATGRVVRPGGSITVCNAFPKSGTHLLYPLLVKLSVGRPTEGLVTQQSLSGLYNSAQYVHWALGSAPAGAIVRTHLPYNESVVKAMNPHTRRMVMIVRDLRDVVISMARWGAEERHFYLNRYLSSMDTFESQVRASIIGKPAGRAPGDNISSASIRDHFEPFLGWVQDPALAGFPVLVVRYEELVGEAGGGNEDERLSVIERIATFLDSEVRVSAEQFSSQLRSRGESHTLRVGLQGQYRRLMSDATLELFEQTVGDLNRKLGYR